jgi:ABC-type phosphate transport system substrate-binding protein
MENAAKRNAVKEFLNWMLGPGQAQAASLGYVALPEELARKEKSAIEQIQ